MGVCVPEEYGGAGADFLSYILVLEELSRADAGVGVTVAVHTSACTLPILAVRHARSSVARFVPPLARGEGVGCFALTEPGAGSDAGALVDARRAEADGGWQISGAKQWITNAAFGGTILLFARTDSESQTARGVSAFILDTDQVTITRTEEKLGLNSSVTNDIAVDSFVDADRLLGERDHGFRIAMATLDGGRIGIAAQAVGIAQAAYDVALGTRRSARRSGSTIADFQAIQHKLANMSMEIDAARLLVAPRGVAEGPGQAAHRGGREGEALRVRDGAPPDGGGDPGARRLRLHEGVPRRALLPRREDHGDLRGDERDPAPRDRALDPRCQAPWSRPRTMSRRERDEPVRLTKIYTRGGDAGETSLGDMSRVSKLDPLVRAYGAVDELNSVRRLGARRSAEPTGSCASRTSSSTSAPTCPSPSRRATASCAIDQAAIDRLEADCDEANAPLEPLKSFILPGGSEQAGTAARRARRLPPCRARGAGRGAGAARQPARRSST